MEFKKGQTHYILIPSMKIEKFKIHVCSVIDENFIVYKWYGRHKQWWHYVIEHKQTLKWKIEQAKDFGN